MNELIIVSGLIFYGIASYVFIRMLLSIRRQK